MYNYLKNRLLSFLLPVQVLLVVWASKHPHWIEKNYSQGIYPIISRFMRRILGWIPISVGDIFYLLLILFILRWLWKVYQTRMSPFKDYLYGIGAFISVFFFAFHFLWGLNYYRLPLAKQLGIPSLEYSEELLIQTTEKHIKNLNEIHFGITKNDSIPVEIPYTKRNIYRMSYQLYKNGRQDPIDLNFKTKSIKNSLISVPLTYMGFSGYLNPFSGESQVNRKAPKTSFPVTACHEMAHQLGYASEDEANFIGYLQCKQSTDPYFQYSAELMAVNYLLKAVKQNDETAFQTLIDSLNYGVRLNNERNHDFWDSYHTPLEPIFKKIYDRYLKANSQKKGIRSYHDMVGYLVKFEK